MQRLRRDDPDVEHLLHSLAYARGNGIPRTNGIWETAGSAIAGHRITDAAVTCALETAGSYIVQDAEFGDECYRLGHRTYTEYYLAQDRAHTPNPTTRTTQQPDLSPPRPH